MQRSIRKNESFILISERVLTEIRTRKTTLLRNKRHLDILRHWRKILRKERHRFFPSQKIFCFQNKNGGIKRKE